MVSKARLDLPDPESPVTTTSLSRGISTEMFLRLCTRAPCTEMLVRAFVAAGTETLGLELTGRFLQIEKRELLHENVAPPGKLNRGRRFPYELLVGQVLAGSRHSVNIEVALEVILDFRRRARFADFAEVVDHGSEQSHGALLYIRVDGVQSSLNILTCFVVIEKIGVNCFEERWVQFHRLRDHFPVGQHSAADDFDPGERRGGVEDP